MCFTVHLAPHIYHGMSQNLVLINIKYNDNEYLN